MDDTCIVCAESLEWVAYGACGHREVCSTCVVRMRFVLDDRRCCLCKIESPTVFITKAMGDYTRVITDFSQFPPGASEGHMGNFWYHEDTQAYFDDRDHYQMIKAMCRLSCSECDKAGDQSEGGMKRRSRFRNVEHLKSHLFHRHKLFMCNLCLENRKVFICEQKLYTKAQLNRHINGGDSEVDGTEREREGFKGHPMCEFCRTPFYGDNELYIHMSTEHYTCHICQRQHSGQYDYFRNYDDLEIHFRQEHFLCESEECLAKKFIVFPSEAELKRHNAIEHGGTMSRSKRNAALQIPTSFRYRRAEQDQRRGRSHAHGPRHESSDHQLSLAIQASLDSSTASNRNRTESPPNLPPERAPPSVGPTTSPLPSIEDAFPPLSERDLPETSSKYAKALVQGSAAPSRLGGEAFPPLPGASEPVKIISSNTSRKPSIASHLRQKSKAAAATATVALNPISAHNPPPSFPTSSPQLWPTPSQEFKPLNPSSSRSSSQPRSTPSVNKPISIKEPPFLNHKSSGNGSGSSLSHSSSAPDLRAIVDDDVRAANKTLVERIRTELGMDEDKFAAFKHISSEYREGLTDTWEYLSYVEQFGLLHLVPELARLCPDPQKQRELLGSYNVKQKGGGGGSGGGSSSKAPSKGKGKSMAVPPQEPGDGILEAVKKLQLNHKQEEEVEVLSKDGYRSKVEAPRQRPKKVSKFSRMRLGGDEAVTPEVVEEETLAPGWPEGGVASGVWRRGGGSKLFPSAGGRR